MRGDWTAEDEEYMRMALALAARAKGRTSPNPMVGAVLVSEGRVVGRGYHRYAGGPHAEVYALREAGERARGATLYVNLEPCSHFGRTPPCADALIAAGVKSVVAAMEDPNPEVSGKGIARLMAAGIEVRTGLLRDRAERLNEVFIKYITRRLPFVALKCAMSLDGKIATWKGASRWITGEKARDFVHHLRDTYDAVMVGIGTVLQDDPQLTTRLKRGKGRNPLRIVVDSKLRIPLTSRVLTDTAVAPTLVVTTPDASPEKAEEIRARGAKIMRVEGGPSGVNLAALLRELGKIGVTSILIEGGGELNASAFLSGIVDKVYAFIAPKIIGGRGAITPVEGDGVEEVGDAIPLHFSTFRRLGGDLLIEAYVSNTGSGSDVHRTD